MIGKMKSIQIDNNDIVSAVTKLRPQIGDIIIYHIKTDEYGSPLCDMSKLGSIHEHLCEILPQGVGLLMLFDKICLDKVANFQETIECLENCISILTEAENKVRDIKNGNYEGMISFQKMIVEVREDQIERSL